MISVNYSLLLFAVVPIPYGVEQSPPLRRSPITLLLVVANIAIFLATHVTRMGLIDPIGLNNEYGLTPASVSPLQIIAYMFLHLNAAHVLWNMMFLALFGPAVERRVGSLLFLAVYLLGGVAAGLMHAGIVMHFAANSSAAYQPLIGASGAVAAVLGLFAVFAWTRALNLFWPLGALFGRGGYLLEVSSGVAIAIWLVQTIWGASLSFFEASDAGVAYFAHIGGFLFGMACGLFGGLRASPAGDTEIGSRGASGSTDGQVPVNAPRSRTAATVGLAQLLEHAVFTGDYERADSLYAKCRSTGTPLSAYTIERLSELAAENGDSERAAELRARAKLSNGGQSN